MSNPTEYFKVSVHGLKNPRVSIFYRSEQGNFDLRYGWAKYSGSMHSTLDEAMHDVLDHIKKDNPGELISLGSPKPITKEEAGKYRPT